MLKSPRSELTTIRDYIRWGMSRFNEAGIYFGHGTTNALDEAAYLVLHTLNLPPQVGEGYLDCVITTEERDAVVAVIHQRIEKRIPAPYITHEAWFCGVPFYVDERVLIPRSPIAELIESQYSQVIDPKQVKSVLDLCCGNGCIGIATALNMPDVLVECCDLSTDALEVAAYNIDMHGVGDSVSLFESDLFNALEGIRYDIIVSNPPYVDLEDMETLPPEYMHEPRFALESGDDGLDATRTILREAASHLNPGGVLIVEVGNSRYHLETQYPDIPFQWLEFERGGEGVFLLTYEQLTEFKDRF